MHRGNVEGMTTAARCIRFGADFAVTGHGENSIRNPRTTLDPDFFHLRESRFSVTECVPNTAIPQFYHLSPDYQLEALPPLKAQAEKRFGPQDDYGSMSVANQVKR